MGRTRAYVLDMRDRFVVLSVRKADEAAEHGLFRAEVVDRVSCGTVEIGAFPAGGRVAGEHVRAVSDLLNKHPSATARVTALHTPGESAEASRLRADAVRNALIVALGDDDYAGETGILLDEVRVKGEGADLGARRAWTDPQRLPHATPGVRVDIEAPPSDKV